MEQKSLAQNIADAMRAKNLDVPKLAQLTGISERYLDALLKEEFAKLPAAPYVKGYLSRLAAVLNLDAEKIWAEYIKDNESLRRAGRGDRMPENRFVQKTGNPRLFIAGAAIILFAMLGALRVIYINNPKLEFENLSGDITIVNSRNIVIRGKIDPNYKLLLGSEEIVLNKDGVFQKELFLEPGFNTLVFKARRLFGREHVVTRSLLYEEQGAVLENLSLPGAKATTSPLSQ